MKEGIPNPKEIVVGEEYGRGVLIIAREMRGQFSITEGAVNECSLKYQSTEVTVRIVSECVWEILEDEIKSSRVDGIECLRKVFKTTFIYWYIDLIGRKKEYMDDNGSEKREREREREREQVYIIIINCWSIITSVTLCLLDGFIPL